MGRLFEGFAARVVDGEDNEVPDGTPGELVLRADAAFAFGTGYFGTPEKTVEAWRNLWFHTGDRVIREPDGYFKFVDRLKDAIRRRGENISSFEVETELCAHPAIREAAAVAVPSEFAEEEVLAAIALVEGATLDPAELIAFLTPRMAHFMVPRYIRIVPALPKTPTQKVQKHLLRSEGITADTWDREKAGIRLKRQRLSA
jgi:crotonobetaine/carnitine-CoA ligase